ncbi:hypothetical protein CIL05_10925 [Virgibacillus profundi]|uniref:Sporulation inhibitor of replication protein SirA n=1 Tax=Virgibacillus profundi TaxID=2024555 RepID=A0A2A2IDZ1_9BACI|nr:sporulation inhibitor of replication protein SirA [Virgibacillus profundi]PAV29375.1 hypothetical protein CIL05_10925 [Virgibacillus profundi]PXY53545.1 sporulation inhibitor of replication protein SirA [Virgibacillus profundi]
MYTYSVYWINEEVAKHYFHKSDILYRFLRDYQNNPDRIDLITQFEYITNSFSEKKLVTHFKKQYREQKVLIKINSPRIEIYKDTTSISLHISEKQLEFRCKTLQDAEEILFPILRKFQPILFITGINIDNYGWISPVIISSNYQEKQVLYSHL